jgi:hypothetical protein
MHQMIEHAEVHESFLDSSWYIFFGGFAQSDQILACVGVRWHEL